MSKNILTSFSPPRTSSRRAFLASLPPGLAAAARLAAASPASEVPAGPTLLTVRGPLPAADLGFALTHEHILVDFIGAAAIAPGRYDPDVVFATVLPHLQAISLQGVRAFFECTPDFLGRDPLLLRRLSTASGLHILTNTGLYGAAQDKFLPPYAFTESAEQLAARWIAEFTAGIAGTGIRPGFIKSGVDPDPELSPIDRKLVLASAQTHRATGLAIAIHTGRGPGIQILDTLEAAGAPPAAFVWVHAQNAPLEAVLAAARRGAWISLDGLHPSRLDLHLDRCLALRAAGLLHRLLLSHDAGWYDPAKPAGGDFRPYDQLVPVFLPRLRSAGFSPADIHTITVANPAAAFALPAPPDPLPSPA